MIHMMIGTGQLSCESANLRQSDNQKIRLVLFLVDSSFTCLTKTYDNKRIITIVHDDCTIQNQTHTIVELIK